MATTRRSLQREAWWRDVMRRHRESGLSVRVFCGSQQINEASFYAWRQELLKRDAEVVAAAPGTAARAAIPDPSKRPPIFVPITVAQPPSNVSDVSGSGVVIELRGGRRVRVPESFSTERLASLLLALEAGEATR